MGQTSASADRVSTARVGDCFRLILPATALGDEVCTSLLYLDCGAWTGSDRDKRQQRDFAVVSGTTAMLASFTTKERLQVPEVGPREERERIGAVLRALAGPQGLDVQVTWADTLDLPSDSAKTYVLLPDIRLPLITPLPELDPSLIPDPKKATCACHGPIVSRILYGDAGQSPQYRAVGGVVSRNPNDWFYLMARSYDSLALDLIRFVDRLARPLSRGGLELVHVGRPFDVWDGFDCVYSVAGAMAFVRPRIVPRVRDEDLVSWWIPKLMKTRSLEAIQRLYRIPSSVRMAVDAPLEHEPIEDGARPHPAQHRDGPLFAENRPEPIPVCRDELPRAFLSLREQKARFTPWANNLGDDYRPPMYAAAAREYCKQPFNVYAMAHTQVPRITIVELIADDFVRLLESAHVSEGE